jgi:hypothetical protein
MNSGTRKGKPGATGNNFKEDKMPIGDVKYNRSNGDYPTAKPGTYKAILQDVKEGLKDEYNAEEGQYECLTFRYVLQTVEGEVSVFRDCRMSLHERSNLYKDLSAIAGEKLSEVVESDATVTEFLNGQIGKTFLVTVEEKVSKASRKYNKFISVAQPPVEVSPEGQVAFDGGQDDIPF